MLIVMSLLPLGEVEKSKVDEMPFPKMVVLLN